MFLVDVGKKRIYHYDNKNIIEIEWDFVSIRKFLKIKFSKNNFTGKNVCLNYFLLSKTTDRNKDILIFDTRRKCNIKINHLLLKTVSMPNIFRLLYCLDPDIPFDDIPQRMEIYGECKIKQPSTITINSVNSLYRSWLVIDWHETCHNLHIYHISFSYALWIYHQIGDFIGNKCKWVDPDGNIALKKAISEAIERISWSKPQPSYTYSEEYTYLFKPYINTKEFTEKNALCKYARLHNIMDSSIHVYCPMEIISYPYLNTLYSWIWNSNGMATHTSLLKAKESALLEIIERDCFIMMRLLKTWIYRIHTYMLSKKSITLIQKLKKNHNVSLEIYVIKFDNPIPVTFILAHKNKKNLVGTWIGKTLDEAIGKGIQEIVWMTSFFDSDINVKSSNPIMEHIQYYLDPTNNVHIKRLTTLKYSSKKYIQNLFPAINTISDILKEYKRLNIEFYMYRYQNNLHAIFKRYTVRIVSNMLLPIYFWSNIPPQILQSERLRYWQHKLWIKTINTDLHPMW